MSENLVFCEYSVRKYTEYSQRDIFSVTFFLLNLTILLWRYIIVRASTILHCGAAIDDRFCRDDNKIENESNALHTSNVGWIIARIRSEVLAT